MLKQRVNLCAPRALSIFFGKSAGDDVAIF